MDNNTSSIEDIKIAHITKQHEFLSNPKVKENFSLLNDIGVISYINSLNIEISNYQDFFFNGLNIFQHTNIGDIIETAVLHIVHRINPSSIVFLWKPFQNKDEISIKTYDYKSHYKMMDLNLNIENLSFFENFFKQYPQFLITYPDLLKGMNHKSAEELCKLEPELIIPILGPSSLYGLIVLGKKPDGESFSNMDMVFIRYYTYFVSLAIQNNLNYDHSLRDVKTGLYNYGFFMTRLTEELARMKRNMYVSSVIVADVDDFKKFNDTYGHIAGDRVLEHVASMIRQSVRLEDVPSRFGGEEFTVLLPDTNSEEAFRVAERLRKSISRLQVSWEVPLSPVTISLGIFSFDNSVSSIYEIVDNADKALYKSKERGKNCTTIWA